VPANPLARAAALAAAARQAADDAFATSRTQTLVPIGRTFTQKHKTSKSVLNAPLAVRSELDLLQSAAAESEIQIDATVATSARETDTATGHEGYWSDLSDTESISISEYEEFGHDEGDVLFNGQEHSHKDAAQTIASVPQTAADVGQRRMQSCSPSPDRPAKRSRNAITIRAARVHRAEATRIQLQHVYDDIRSRLTSKKAQWAPGQLQHTHACAIKATLSLMLTGKVGLMEASRISALGNEFSEHWGSRLVRRWTRDWIEARILPESHRGHHRKIISLLSDPTFCEAVRAYLRSNKWSQSPRKLQKLLNRELSADEAQGYIKQLTLDEMPRGLKQYVEDVLLPRYHLKPGHKGLSLSTMWNLMLAEGFAWTQYGKAVYFDGHERPDVVRDRNECFIPEMCVI